MSLLCNIKQIAIVLILLNTHLFFAMESNLKSIFKAIKNKNNDAAIEDFIKTNDVNVIDEKSKWTPLACACFYDNCFAVKELIKAGADVNFVTPSIFSDKGCTILQIASSYSRLAVVKALVENGALIRSGDSFCQECKQIVDFLERTKEERCLH